MSNHEPSACFEKPLRQYDVHTNTLIDYVRDEEFRDKVLVDVFKQSTLENPYLKNVMTTTDICTELREEKRKKFIEDKRRQQLRENHQELKFLEQQIRAGYVMKTVQAQIFEKKALEDESKAKEVAESQRILDARMKSDVKEEEKLRAQKVDLRKELLDQMSYKKDLLREKYEELLRDREIMEEAVRKYNEDMEREKHEQREKIIRTRRAMDERVLAKERFLAQQKQTGDEEEERYRKLMMKRDEEYRKAREEKRQKILQKQLISEEIGKQIHAIETEKARQRDILADLLCDELEAKKDQQEREQLARKQQDRILAIQEMEQKKREKEEQKLAEKREEEAFYAQQMRNLAERDRLEQLSDEKRRRKQMEHRRSLLEAFNNEKRRKAEAMKGMITASVELENDEKRREQLVKEERIRMLKEHAHILKFCAPGMVSDSEKKLLNVKGD